MPRSIEALKNDRKIVRVSQGLHKEIDTFRFSGPEQFSADAPLILLLFAKIIFRHRSDRGAQKRSNSPTRSQGLHKEIDTFRFSGPEHFFADAPLILLLFTRIIFRRRFDRFRCLDRSKRSRRSKINYTVSFRFIQTRSYILQPPPHRSQRYSLHFNSFSLFSIVLCLFLFFFSLSFSFSLSLSSFFLPLLDLGTKFKSALVTREKTCIDKRQEEYLRQPGVLDRAPDALRRGGPRHEPRRGARPARGPGRAAAVPRASLRAARRPLAGRRLGWPFNGALCILEYYRVVNHLMARYISWCII